MKNLELLKERLERQLKKIDFQLLNAKARKNNETNENYVNYLEGQKKSLEMAIDEIKWEETKIINNW